LLPWNSSCGILLKDIAFVGERFAKYTVIFVISTYNTLDIPDIANIKMRARDIIVRIERFTIPFWLYA
jgi:hypothetical protein